MRYSHLSFVIYLFNFNPPFIINQFLFVQEALCQKWKREARRKEREKKRVIEKERKVLMYDGQE